MAEISGFMIWLPGSDYPLIGKPSKLGKSRSVKQNKNGNEQNKNNDELSKNDSEQNRSSYEQNKNDNERSKNGNGLRI
jgi:hypothetical protein